MTLLQILALLAVAFGIALVAAGRGTGLAAADPDRPPLDLPDQITSSEIADLTFSLGVRGYRMDEVDLALQRISTTLAHHEEEIARLRAALAGEMNRGE